MQLHSFDPKEAARSGQHRAPALRARATSQTFTPGVHFKHLAHQTLPLWRLEQRQAGEPWAESPLVSEHRAQLVQEAQRSSSWRCHAWGPDASDRHWAWLKPTDVAKPAPHLQRLLLLLDVDKQMHLVELSQAQLAAYTDSAEYSIGSYATGPADPAQLPPCMLQTGSVTVELLYAWRRASDAQKTNYNHPAKHAPECLFEKVKERNRWTTRPRLMAQPRGDPGHLGNKEIALAASPFKSLLLAARDQHESLAAMDSTSEPAVQELLKTAQQHLLHARHSRSSWESSLVRDLAVWGAVYRPVTLCTEADTHASAFLEREQQDNIPVGLHFAPTTEADQEAVPVRETRLSAGQPGLVQATSCALGEAGWFAPRQGTLPAAAHTSSPESSPEALHEDPSGHTVWRPVPTRPSVPEQSARAPSWAGKLAAPQIPESQAFVPVAGAVLPHPAQLEPSMADGLLRLVRTDEQYTPHVHFPHLNGQQLPLCKLEQWCQEQGAWVESDIVARHLQRIQQDEQRQRDRPHLHGWKKPVWGPDAKDRTWSWLATTASVAEGGLQRLLLLPDIDSSDRLQLHMVELTNEQLHRYTGTPGFTIGSFSAPAAPVAPVLASLPPCQLQVESGTVELLYAWRQASDNKGYRHGQWWNFERLFERVKENGRWSVKNRLMAKPQDWAGRCQDEPAEVRAQQAQHSLASRLQLPDQKASGHLHGHLQQLVEAFRLGPGEHQLGTINAQGRVLQATLVLHGPGVLPHHHVLHHQQQQLEEQQQQILVLRQQSHQQQQQLLLQQQHLPPPLQPDSCKRPRLESSQGATAECAV